jgi:hypothetical protein
VMLLKEAQTLVCEGWGAAGRRAAGCSLAADCEQHAALYGMTALRPPHLLPPR